jgi:hypothetical protein
VGHISSLWIWYVFIFFIFAFILHVFFGHVCIFPKNAIFCQNMVLFWTHHLRPSSCLFSTKLFPFLGHVIDMLTPKYYGPMTFLPGDRAHGPNPIFETRTSLKPAQVRVKIYIYNNLYMHAFIYNILLYIYSIYNINV